MAIKSRQQAPKQSDVARRAGVSQATVSAVINGRATVHRIPDETVRRVREAVRDLGYVANPSARSLRGKRNRLLGVHTFESVFPISQRDFYHEFLIGIEEQAVADGYDLVLFTSTEEANGQRRIYRDGMNRLNVADGSVLLGFTHDSSDIARLAGEGYPFVHVGRREVPGVDFRWVGADYKSATHEVVDRLVELGHRRIGYVGLDHRMEALIDREEGYRDGCEAAGLPPLPVLMGVHHLGVEWFDHAVASGMTAFVAEDESYATKLGELVRERGLDIPGDVSVVVLRGTNDGPVPGRSWSSMGIPRNEMGRAAARMLVEILEDPHATRDDHLLLPCTPPGETTMAAVGGAA
ncbi:LacI family DNA-binding transcriptional regulator [Phytoactinopolyspora endophytica]|uniref:LacI family DNA-binding transcriptional regulator n=1 Tax=Phytoactinopolyspora endophytica TaxID=1642495 RepID=UPI00197C3802|nr:LacI family DNA-binding transcriptional regulator [Phytoactinopolyspora endophytica]